MVYDGAGGTRWWGWDQNVEWMARVRGDPRHRGSLHATGVELAASHRDADHTGRESQQQRVAGPVQGKREHVAGLWAAISTPGGAGQGPAVRAGTHTPSGGRHSHRTHHMVLSSYFK